MRENLIEMAAGVRREAEQKAYEARVSTLQGEQWVAVELNRRAAALFAAATILERLAVFRKGKAA